MIAKGTTHNNGAKLASYMTTGKDGERAELWQLRGFEATTIKDAFRDVQIMADGTRCEQPFFHLQVRNREGEKLTRQQWEYTANRIESMLGLTGQPRAIAFHTYERSGYEHMHIAWSRIDEDTLTAKALPFFKERLKKISRELELHFAFEPVKNEREGVIKYAPTKAQDEQARRLGVDIHAIRNTIRQCYDRSDCGKSFQAALEHENLILAEGDRRELVVIDHAGGVHALGKRILDVSVAKIRARLSDLDRDELPTVEEVRAFVGDIKVEKQQGKSSASQERDRDRATVRDQIQWEDALAKAAIAKDEQERKRAGAAIKDKPQMREDKGAGQQERNRGVYVERPWQTGPELARNAGEIRLAYSLTKTGQEFANALEDRGFILACVTSKDAERLNRWERQRLKELEALNPIPEQQPEQKRAGRKNLTRADTWMAQVGGLENLSEELREKAEANYDRWDGDKQKYDLADYVGYVQRQEAKRQQQSSGLEEDHYDRYKVGELVVVNQQGHVFQLTRANTGDALKARSERLIDIDRAALLSVSAADSAMQKFRQHQRDERPHERQNAINEQWSTTPTASDYKSASVFQEANVEAARDTRPEKLTGVAAKVWELWTKIDREKHAKSFEALHSKDIPFSVATEAKAFAAALDEKGFMFATATKEEAERSHREAAFARAVGNYSARFNEGEIVIVTERPVERSNQLPGRERSIASDHASIDSTGRIHKIDQSLAAKFVKTLDDEPRSIETTLGLSEQRLQKRRNDRQKEREQQGKHELKDLLDPESKLRRTIKRKTLKAAHKAGRGAEKIVDVGVTAGKAAGTAGAVAEKVLDVVAGLMDSLFTTTPAQAREAKNAKAGREAEAEDEIEFSRFTGDVAQQRQKQENDRQAARQREHERGGRER